MTKHIMLITLFSLCTNTVFAERFLNVSTKKVKITIFDKATKEKVKQFDLKPLHPEDVDLSKYTQGVTITVKAVKGSYLSERKLEDLCHNCGKKVETICGCKNKPSKKDKSDQEVDLELSSREMKANNEFIILFNQEELKIKTIETQQASRLDRIKNKENKK